MPPRCLPRRRRRCQPLCATPRRRHPGPRRWPWPRHRRHRPGRRGRLRCDHQRRRRPGAVVRVIPVRGGGLGVIVSAGLIARTRGRLVPARVGGWVVPAGTAGQGAGLIVRAGGRRVARVPVGPACRGALAGPGQPGTPASIGPISLIRLLRAAAVSLRRPGLLLLRAGPRGAGPDIRTRPLRGWLVPGRGRLPGPVVVGGAGTGWLFVAFLAEVTEVTDEGQRDAPWRGGDLFLLVGFLRLDVGFLLGVGCFLPGSGCCFPAPSRLRPASPARRVSCRSRARVVGRGVTPGEEGAERPGLYALAGRALVGVVPRLVLVTRRRGTRPAGNARRPGTPVLTGRGSARRRVTGAGIDAGDLVRAPVGRPAPQVAAPPRGAGARQMPPAVGCPARAQRRPPVPRSPGSRSHRWPAPGDPARPGRGAAPAAWVGWRRGPQSHGRATGHGPARAG